jgi:MFS family permease
MPRRAVLILKRLTSQPAGPQHTVDSPYAWWRLVAALALMTVGSSAMYVISVVLPAVQRDFGVTRSDASLPYTVLMLGFGLGGILMGRLADRFGVALPLWLGGLSLGLGFWLSTLAPNMLVFTAVHGVLLGLLGSSATFAPLVADASLWFLKRRGIAVAVCACGNYVAGALWPPIVQSITETQGWRAAYGLLALICGVSLPLLAIALRVRAPLALAGAASPAGQAAASQGCAALGSDRPFALSPLQAQTLLCMAGLACCVAMSMPQVHIVAYCGDLGYGATRGAQMLSLMLAFGVASRLISGAICDRIGGLRTLLLGSGLQGLALLLFIPFDGLVSLYIISAMFGLFQGGIVPSYAIIVREHFSPAEASRRVGTVLMFTLFGMALGGWLSGRIFDWTGSYDAAFVNGVAWNAMNLLIGFSLWRRARQALRAEGQIAESPPRP